MPRSRRNVQSGSAIGVEGLRDMARDLRQLKTDVPKGLRPAHKAVADLVKNAAVQKAETLGPADARAAAALRTSATQTGASILLDPTRVPFALGREFGAQHDVPRQTTRGTVRGWNQFRSWRGKGDTAGYFLYPSVRSTAAQQMTVYERALDDILRPVFPD